MSKYLLYCLSFFIFITTTQAQLGNYIGPTSTGNLGSEGAGQNITTGQYNVALGDSALYNLTLGYYCTAIGYRAGYTMTGFTPSFSGHGSDNTFIGYLSGSSTTTGSDNTFIGKNSGRDNTTGRDNTFMGAESGRINTTGHDNTFFGDRTGYVNTVGDYNTFIGGDAGYNNTIGFRNTFLGRFAGYDNTTGGRNTCVGDSAGTDGGKGSHNTMVGQAAGPTTEHGSYNTFIGSWAGGDNNRTNNDNGWDGMFNTALGAFAGFTNREGQGNVVLGYKADFTSNIGLNISSPGAAGNNDNVAIGRQAIIGSVGGGFNGGIGKNGVVTIGAYSRVNEDFGIAIGHTALNYGLGSIAIGHLVNLTASMDSVVVIGESAAATGSNAISLGFKAAAGTNSLALGSNATVTGNNSIAIGSGTTVSANNEVYLGNTSTASIGGAVNWTATSDGRFKTNVQENVPGLDFINNLRPVTYNFDPHKLNAFNQETTLNLDKTTVQYTGFIAQEVEATALELGYDFSGVKVPEDKTTQMYGIRYAEFVVPLVKATQELSLLVQQQEKTIQDYRQQAELTNQKINTLKAELEQKNKATIDMKASLEQRIEVLEDAIMSTTKAN